MTQGYFKHIPNIQYDFKSDGKFYRAKDMFRKVGFVDFWNNYDKQIIGDSEEGDGFTTIIDPDVYEGGK